MAVGAQLKRLCIAYGICVVLSSHRQPQPEWNRTKWVYRTSPVIFRSFILIMLRRRSRLVNFLHLIRSSMVRAHHLCWGNFVGWKRKHEVLEHSFRTNTHWPIEMKHVSAFGLFFQNGLRCWSIYSHKECSDMWTHSHGRLGHGHDRRTVSSIQQHGNEWCGNRKHTDDGRWKKGFEIKCSIAAMIKTVYHCPFPLFSRCRCA